MTDDTARPTDEQPPLRVLHYADLESAYDDPERVGALAGRIDDLRDDRTLVLGAGDNTALGVLSLLTDEGRGQARPFFERVAPDADTFGNHDFDFGREWALEWAETVPATYCCANLAGPGADRVPDGTVVERGGLRVGVVGLAHPDTADICGTVDDLRFGDPVAAAREAFDDLPPVDHRVVVSHCGALDPEIAAGVDADAVLGGHLHRRETDRVDGTLLVRTAGGGRELSVVTLGPDPSVAFSDVPGGSAVGTAGVSGAAAPAEAADGGEADEAADGGVVGAVEDGGDVTASDVPGGPVPVDDAVATVYRQRRRELGVDEVVARVDSPLPRTARERFGGESRLGNFAADAFRRVADADVGIFPGGSLRTGDPLTGDVTVADVVALCPFGGSVVELELDGGALRRVLTEAAHPHPGDRGWVQLHVSGMRVVWTDANDLRSAAVDGEPLDVDRSYRVAVPVYLVDIDAYAPLDRDNAVADHVPQWEALVAHARDGGLDVDCEGRIERIPVGDD